MALGSRVFIFVLLMLFFFAEATEGIDCNQSCAVRCSRHSRPNVCTRACATCCRRCNCVPPGTSGNHEKCGDCYTKMRTHGNRLKCP